MVKFPYWGALNYADSLCIKISPIFYMANPNPNPTGTGTPQYRNYPESEKKNFNEYASKQAGIKSKLKSFLLPFGHTNRWLACDITKMPNLIKPMNIT